MSDTVNTGFILDMQRIFRVPEFLATAFLLGVLALLVHLLLGA